MKGVGHPCCFVMANRSLFMFFIYCAVFYKVVATCLIGKEHCSRTATSKGNHLFIFYSSLSLRHNYLCHSTAHCAREHTKQWHVPRNCPRVAPRCRSRQPALKMFSTVLNFVTHSLLRNRSLRALRGGLVRVAAPPIITTITVCLSTQRLLHPRLPDRTIETETGASRRLRCLLLCRCRVHEQW